jgi:hypothetical protein
MMYKKSTAFSRLREMAVGISVEPPKFRTKFSPMVALTHSPEGDERIILMRSASQELNKALRTY